jgi:hypothetical protein
MTDFRNGKCILLMDSSEHGSDRWTARVELFEAMMRDMGMVETIKMLNSEKLLRTTSSKVEGWLIDTWKAEYERLSKASLETIREAGSVQQSWDIVEYHTFEDLEKVEKPIKTASISKDFGI